MKNYCGNIVEKVNVTIKKMVSVFTLSALAEEEDSTTPTPPTLNYEDLIAKARKEEKDKHYGTIEKLKGQCNTLTEQHNTDLLKIAEFEKQLSEFKNSGIDIKEVNSLKEEVESLKKSKVDLETKLKDFEGIVPVDRNEIESKVRKELEAEYEVKTYKVTKLAEMKDDILVPELVNGNTIEEIDKSIQLALNRSEEIKKSLGYNSTPRRTPNAPSPSVKNNVQEVSAERLATLDVRSKEYAELRKQLGLR